MREKQFESFIRDFLVRANTENWDGTGLAPKSLSTEEFCYLFLDFNWHVLELSLYHSRGTWRYRCSIVDCSTKRVRATRTGKYFTDPAKILQTARLLLKKM